MAQTNFESILDKAPSDIKPPEAYPVGEYLCTVRGMPRYDKSTKKETEFVEYTLIINQAMESVDADDLAAIEGGIVGKPIKATYYLTNASLYRLKEFFEHCGLDVEGAESLRELMDQPNGCSVVASIGHEASKDGKRTYSKLIGTAPVES